MTVEDAGSGAEMPVRRPMAGRRRAVAASLGAHLAVLAVILWPRAEPPKSALPDVRLQLIDAPRPIARAKPAPAVRHATAEPASPAPQPRSAPHAAPVHRVVTSAPAILVAAPGSGTAVSAELGDGELAGAAGVGAEPRGECDMAHRLQAALRRDGLVQTAARESGGRALKVWDGDWVANPGQDGKGLAAVREAILWEVGFAPAACRNQAMRGLVLISLGETQGSTRLALGAGAWRWSDLLRPTAPFFEPAPTRR